uniref:Uncharacterized protein n=1 Tax=Physcomitrium patens TaxID=3218 RepID=A0A2K1K2F2_PHYPA|nr:hypothetical protein PHYPA_012429 [Physcomitrium patens]
MTLEFLKKPTLIEWTHTIYAYNASLSYLLRNGSAPVMSMEDNRL